MGIVTLLGEFSHGLRDWLAISIPQFDFGGNGITIVCKTDADRLQISGSEIVPDTVFRAFQQIHVPKNSAGTELILSFS